MLDTLPSHLRVFVREQDYARYSAKDHAAWRVLLRMLTKQLSASAHPVYLEGMEKTGITLNRIPTIEGMNEKLAALGWAAVVVDGFIPPAIFMEFQARRILPIAQDMRSTEHLLYTPAPDIVHEAAGHAPFIVDSDYAEFLQQFGEVGMKALATQQDHAVYEAIRHLSIVKEMGGASGDDIRDAEQALQQCLAAKEKPSEAALLSRLHWWTVEYGLVGTPQDYRLFGAGLLSSLGESRNCLDDERVKKRVLTVDSIATDYDITSEQPQLFVAASCRHLSQVLYQFSEGMAFRRGGLAALEKAIDAGVVCTAQYNSGLQVSGKISTVCADAMGNPIYLSTEGETQLSYGHSQLLGHGIDRHPQGFGSPIGRIQNLTQSLANYSVDELAEHGIRRGESVTLKYVSGITVSGRLEHIERRDHKNILLSFSQCRVVDANGDVLFSPEWGHYDLAVGDVIESVFGGAADRSQFPLYRHLAVEPTPVPGNHVVDTSVEALYNTLNQWHWQGGFSKRDIRDLIRILQDHPQEWLARCDLLQLVGTEHSVAMGLSNALQTFTQGSDQVSQCVHAFLKQVNDSTAGRGE